MKIQTKTFRIEGMSCASCVKRVESTLREQEGIESVTVNLASETASVSYDSEAIKPEQLQKSIAHIGYKLIDKGVLNHKTTFWSRYGDIILLSLAGLLTLPLLLPMYADMLSIPWTLSPLTQLLLTIPVQFIVGWRFYVQAWRAIRNTSLNMDVLVAVGTTAAFLLSVYLGFFTAQTEHPHLYFESAAVIITLVLFGKYLEKKAKQKTTESLRALEALRADHATVIKNGEERRVPIFKVIKGDHVVVRPSERIPVDGTILKGTTTVDESLITGESLPIFKEPNQKVVSGALNIDGLITIEAQSVESESMLSQIIQLMEDAHQKKAPIEKLVDRVSEVFVPTVIILALITLIAWKILGAQWEFALINAISVLVIACPCALGLATPTALMVGRGWAARRGILIKDAEALEKVHSLKAVIFDKTGTLTEGKPTIVETVLAPKRGLNEIEFLRLAYGLQKNNTHPLAQAVVKKAWDANLVPEDFVGARIFPGKGSEGVRKNNSLLQIGSHAWMRELGYETAELESAYQASLQKGYSTAWIGDGSTKTILGYHGFSDQIREQAAETIAELHKIGLQTVLLSGDKKEAAEVVAKQLNITHVISEVLPQEKLDKLLELRQRWGMVAMVGDGINDAPALAAADLGIAMGSGTDVAVGAAAITLLKNNPFQVVEALEISKATYSKIKQNLFWAFIYNVIGIPLASLGLLNPMIAAAAMAFSSVSVVSSSLLLGSSKKSS